MVPPWLMAASGIAGDRAVLVVLVGVPGSGKSTWAQALVRQSSAYCWVSTDRIRASLYGNEAIQGDWWRVWQQVQAEWRQALAAIRDRKLQGVLYDATNCRRRHRREVIAAARREGFDWVGIAWFQVSLAVALERNGQRHRQVSPAVIETMHRQLMGAYPTPEEGADRVVQLP